MNNMKKNSYKFIFLLLVILGISIVISVTIGSSSINFISALKIVLFKIFNLDTSQFLAKDIAIIYILRLPRILIACVVGASLAISGLVLQSLLKNPIASPYTLGVSTGASIGVALVIVTGFTIPFIPNYTQVFIGFISAFLVVIFVLSITKKFDKNLSNTTIVLVGLVLSLTLNGLLTLIILYANNDSKSIIYWQMGSLSLKTYDNLLVLLPFFIVGSVFCAFKTYELDALGFGEIEASIIGVDVKKVKLQVIIIATMLTGSAVATTGTIGFIGLVSPHIARKILGGKHRFLLIVSAIIGAILLIWADTIARTILSPSELPVGAITSLIGGPFFGYIYLRKRGLSNA